MVVQDEANKSINTSDIAITKAPRSYKKLFVAVGLTCAVLIVALAVRWWLYASVNESTDDAYVVSHIHNVSSKVAGTIKNVLVDENKAVKAGQLLILIDPRDYQVKVEQAKAALLLSQQQQQSALIRVPQSVANAQAAATQAGGTISGGQSAIAEARSRLSESKAGVFTSQAQIAEAEANLSRTKADYQRYKILVTEGAVSKQQYDQALAAYRVAQAQDQAAKNNLQAAKSRVSAASQQIAQAQSTLEANKGLLSTSRAQQVQVSLSKQEVLTAKAGIVQATAALHEAELNLSYCRITAAISGKTGKRQAEVGQRIQPGQPLFAVVERTPWIEANFKETQVGRMKLGQRVEIQIDSFPGHHFSGVIESLAPASGAQFALLPPENATGNFTKVVQRIPVKIVFDPKSIKGYEDRISAGMSTVVNVSLR